MREQAVLISESVIFLQTGTEFSRPQSGTHMLKQGSTVRNCLLILRLLLQKDTRIQKKKLQETEDT